jgi:ABC-type lipoprotein export system ATPase subunit
LVLADEPTGNLDSGSAERIIEVLLEIHRRHGTALAIVTHDPLVAACVGRVVRMLDGRILATGEEDGGR